MVCVVKIGPVEFEGQNDDVIEKCLNDMYMIHFDEDMVRIYIFLINSYLFQIFCKNNSYFIHSEILHEKTKLCSSRV